MFQLISMLTMAVWSLQVCAAAGTGAYKKHDKVDNAVLTMAQFAVPRIQQHIKSDKFFTLRSVDRAHTQLVSGTNYRLQVTLVETKCAADAGDAGLKCSAVDQPSSVTCWVLVHDVPWKAARHVTKHKCSRPSQTHAQRLHRKRGKHVKANKLGRLAGKELKTQFRRFVHKYRKGYSGTAEYARRMRIFAENVRHASDFQRLERGSARYGVTKFSDLTVEEWRATWLGLDLSTPRPAPDGAFRQTAVIPDAKDMPKSWDWREKGAVTAVKNQGQCGSCWAFSVTGNVEGQYFLKYNQLLSFSEQELVDCDTDDHGCQGGMPDQAYKFIEFLGGLEQESDYPYEGRNGQCRLNRTDLKVQLSGSLDMPKNEADIQKWLYANGPVSVGVNANPLMFYHGGIIDVWSFLCRASAIDHGVLLVGFGEHDYPVVNKTKPFWIVKNSWGDDWGEQGYFRLFRGSDECGIQDMASSSVVA